ncbi:TetR family transcriptional regulator [Murinocardiopsis flavida]|uniref:TetR family transcriptional regulator n=1 Tax=Murinocardiopsis flavida TaxID=645275 RepID=A0A2P8D932_9ACTN|nr:TetR/AcrR family transcriptional regulator [Murinocardiopsis flavida]PSK93725.1 TetR family transcriptional regulator [Murinocardiopsis flavida]
MPPTESATAAPSLRERRRSVAVHEILGAAERHVVEHGAAALSLRAIARSLGMTVQALYHYFPSRDDLVTALVAKSHDDLADAVDAADAGPGTAAVPRAVAATEGYRGWAVANPERFQLIYGAPLRGYRAPEEGPTTRAVRRMGGVFRRVLFDGFTAAQLAACDAPEVSAPLRAHLGYLGPDGVGALPPPAASLFVSTWGHMHGLVALEVFGHTAFLGAHRAEVFRSAMHTMVEDVHRRIPPADGVVGVR